MFYLCVNFYQQLVFKQYILPQLQEVAENVFGHMMPGFIRALVSKKVESESKRRAGFCAAAHKHQTNERDYAAESSAFYHTLFIIRIGIKKIIIIITSYA